MDARRLRHRGHSAVKGSRVPRPENGPSRSGRRSISGKILSSISGITLIELLIVVIIIGVIAGITAVTLRQGTEQYAQVTSRGEALSRTRFGLDRMTREMRQAKSGTISTWTATAFEFDRPDPSNPGSDNSVRFAWAGAGSPLVRTVDAVSNNLVEDVSSLSFTYYDSNGDTPASVNQIRTILVQLTITAEGETVNLISTVYPRDL